MLKVKIVIFSPVDRFVLKRLEFSELGGEILYVMQTAAEGLGYTVLVGLTENVSAPQGSQHQVNYKQHLRETLF